MRGDPGSSVFQCFVFGSNMGALAWVRWGIVASFLGEYGPEAPGGAVSSILRVAVVASGGRGLALVVDFFGGFGVFCWHLAACGGRCCQWVGDLM